MKNLEFLNGYDNENYKVYNHLQIDTSANKPTGVVNLVINYVCSYKHNGDSALIDFCKFVNSRN